MKKEVREGYKITELGEIPNEWDIVALGEIGEFKNGINKSKEDFGFGCKFVNIQDAYYGNIVKNDLLERINVNDKEKEIYKLENDDIILVRSSVKPEGVGYPILFKKENEDIVYCGFMIRYRYDKRKINPIFLLYQLRSENIRKRVLDLSTVSANTNINQDSYKQIKISIPSIKEQEKIAEILSTVDEQIENIEKLIQKNQELKKGLMQQLLTKGIGHTEFKKTDIGDIPKGWEVKKLGEVCNLQGGYAFKSKDYLDEGIKLVKITNVQQKNIIWDEVSYLPKSYLDKYNEYSLVEGDLVIAMTRPVISTGIKICEVNVNDLPSLLNQRVGRFKCKKEINNKFLYQYMFTDYFLNKVKLMSSMTGQPNISSSQIESIDIVIPSLIEQEKIDLILSSIDKKIEHYESKKEKLEEVKKGLMQQLITGNIRVI